MTVAIYSPALVVLFGTLGRLLGLQSTGLALLFVVLLLVAVVAHCSQLSTYRSRTHERHP